ncbi:odorant receptor 49b-like [Eurosta solidaginis]|uniref:odorant receptor 49b-like n=1 Tax=Eurosta solidaginis TaxID=178769 RepID=UPI003530893F
MIEVALPGIDLYESPYYEIVNTIELCLVPFGLLTYSSYMSVMLISLSFGIFLMKDIQFKLEYMQEMDEMEALTCIKTCLRRHSLIIRFHKKLEALFSLGNFVDVSLFCITPSIILFYSTMEYDLANLVRDAQYISLLSISTFTTFWLANNFCIEGINISRAAYNCNWMTYGKEFRMYVIVLIAISQRPLQLTAGGLKPLNMEFFMVIVRVTYSFFTILKGTVD